MDELMIGTESRMVLLNICQKTKKRMDKVLSLMWSLNIKSRPDHEITYVSNQKNVKKVLD